MIDEKDWDLFKQKFNKKASIDLHDYKPAQMQRRIGNLMSHYGAHTYVEFLIC